MLETVLKTGKDAGFSTVEAFGEKVWRWEADGDDPPLSGHEVQSNRLLVRAFRDSGDPLGFSLSNPDARSIKNYFSSLGSASGPDNKRNYAQLLPRTVAKVKPDIFDPAIEAWQETQVTELLEKIRESMVTFAGLKLKRFHFSRVLKKVYLANTLGFMAKYKKTHFQVQAAFMLHDHLLELSESHVYFGHFNPERLVARAANLLGALTAEPVPESSREFLILSPEASAQMLREFSAGLRLDHVSAKNRVIGASAKVSILDNPALAGQTGSVPFDDEGTTAEEKYLVNKGEFVLPVSDIRSAFARGKRSSGNGFRDERGIFPQVQFSNLYFKPSVSSLADLLRAAGKGILVYLVKQKGFGASPNEYVFSAYGYFFEKEEIARPVYLQFKTSMRSYFLRILDISRELRFFHNRCNVGSPYLLVQGRCDAEKKITI
ncbi:MAG TPA: metallopeptidase TldD-related protein [Candidatus Binatia bacterium]|nr:metallopeptidase TldD-related protein [Candidatus Binatia bacterium]